MKLLVALVALSVAANAALVAAFVNQPSLAPPSVRSYFEFGGRGETTVPEKTAATKSKTSAPKSASDRMVELWRRLQTADLATVVAQLRAAGFPPAFIRALADAELQRRFAPRMEEIRRALYDKPYWQGDIASYMGNAKVYEQMSQLSRERSKALRELIGQDAYAYGGVDATEAQRARFGNIPANKIPLLQQIADDYAEMTSQIRGSMQGITLPEDREKFALLEKSKREDLAAFLTPQELADYEMRTSTITSRLRTGLTIMDASEAEFRQIYLAHEQQQAILYPTTPLGGYTITSDMTEQRRKAQEQINATLKQTLGEARFADYQRASDRDFQQLYQLTRSTNMPYDTVVRAYDTRQPASAASQQIANNASMSSADKEAALKQLGQDSRTQLLSTLGPTAGPAYADGSRWLSALQSGRAFSVGPDGSITTRYIAPTRPTTPTPQPAK
ncbi:MAG: hypothetical protein V4773_10150 [Verrucomicrobiota bacterium]